MAATLMNFARRRLINTLVLVAAGAAAWVLQRQARISLQHPALVTGLFLFALCLALALFNARKKLPFIPLLRAATWTQIHVYAGWFAILLFLLHINFRPPSGVFNVTLAVVFGLVALSGVFGLVLSRVMAFRLTLHGENVMFERIPALRAQLLREAEAIVIKSVEETKSTTIADFYATRLQPYFARPRSRLRHVLGLESPLKGILTDLRLLKRYTNEREHAILAELEDCVEAKDNLDFQLAGQGLLKYWLFVHIPLTASLLILGAIHGLIAFTYVGGFR
jgi:hypothetical protein